MITQSVNFPCAHSLPVIKGTYLPPSHPHPASVMILKKNCQIAPPPLSTIHLVWKVFFFKGEGLVDKLSFLLLLFFKVSLKEDEAA